MSTPTFSLSLVLIFLILILSIVAQAAVPSSKTFKYVLECDLGDYITEYDASYCIFDLYPNFKTSNSPFQLFFYNTTPNAYTLGLRIGPPRYESQKRWVWDANRGNPVSINSTLTFGADGNLVLRNVDGKIAWQTDTKNKGVVDIELLPNGNLVLMDKKRRFVWQSFDYPKDTLLMGAQLRRGGVNKLVSRVSDVDGSEGPYSLVLEEKRLALYFKSKNSPKRLLYYTDDFYTPSDIGQPISGVALKVQPLNEDAFEYELNFEVNAGNQSYLQIIGQPTKFNSTISFLRLGSDGSLKVYSFYPRVERGGWEVIFSAFDRDDIYGVTECRLPSRCGSLGVCEDDQCVACPTPKGLLGYTKQCAPPKLPSCKGNVNYYKVEGVEHFTYVYTQGDGPTKLGDCRAKCSQDCGCLGFFYREESSKCLLAPVLGTLTKVANTSHVAYIKM